MKTVFITGATEGIGYEFVQLFAQPDYELVLVARNEEKLQRIVQQLSEKGIKSHYYAKNLSRVENAIFICNDLKIKNITIDYAINNAGFGISESFIDTEWEKENSMYGLNMISLAYFTKQFAIDMKQKGFGRILNFGSTAAFQPIPYMAAYAATKAFVLSLSQAVDYELKGTNVRVLTLCPGVTTSLFHATANTEKSLLQSSLLPVATAKEVALYGFRLLMKQKTVGVHGMLNRLFIFVQRFLRHVS